MSRLAIFATSTIIFSRTASTRVLLNENETLIIILHFLFLLQLQHIFLYFVVVVYFVNISDSNVKIADLTRRKHFILKM